MVNIWLTFALFVWSKHIRSYPGLFIMNGFFFFLLFIEPIFRRLFKKNHVLYKEFHCSHVLRLFCTQDWMSHHHENFQQIILFLNMPKMNYLGVRGPDFDLHWLLSCVEPNSFLVSCWSLLYWPSLLQWTQNQIKVFRENRKLNLP